MNKLFVTLLSILLISTSSRAEEKFWMEGSEQPNARVNVDLKKPKSQGLFECLRKSKSSRR
jgi:hypothetical protein